MGARPPQRRGRQRHHCPISHKCKTVLDRNPDAALRAAPVPAQTRSQHRLHGLRRAGVRRRPPRRARRDDRAMPMTAHFRRGRAPWLEFPIYYSWRFRTGIDGDFELLVRALVPRDIDPQRGRPRSRHRSTGLRGADCLEPARRSGRARRRAAGAYDGAARAASRRAISRRKVAKVVNTPADERDTPPGGGIGADDPVVAPPIYGSWHAGVERVEMPAARSGLGAGAQSRPALSRRGGPGRRASCASTRTQYMRSAWEQIGDVLAINATIRRGSAGGEGVVRRVLEDAGCARTRDPRRPSPRRAFSKIMGSPITLHAHGDRRAGCRAPRCRRRSASCCGRADGSRARCCPPMPAPGALGAIIDGHQRRIAVSRAAAAAGRMEHARGDRASDSVRRRGWLAAAQPWWLLMLLVAYRAGRSRRSPDGASRWRVGLVVAADCAGGCDRLRHASSAPAGGANASSFADDAGGDRRDAAAAGLCLHGLRLTIR